jgi:hypothetical protein
MSVTLVLTRSVWENVIPFSRFCVTRPLLEVSLCVIPCIALTSTIYHVRIVCTVNSEFLLLKELYRPY